MFRPNADDIVHDNMLFDDAPNNPDDPDDPEDNDPNEEEEATQDNEDQGQNDDMRAFLTALKQMPRAATNVIKLVKPKMGGIVYDQTRDQAVWCGGRPNGVTWIELDAEFKHRESLAAINLAAANFANSQGHNPPTNVTTVLDLAPTANMFRHTGKHEQAAYNRRGQGVPELDHYKSGSGDFAQLATTLREVFKNHGTDSTTWIPDDRNTALIRECVYAQPSHQSVSELAVLMGPVRMQWDKYDIENDERNRTYLLNSLDPVLRKRMKLKIKTADSFAEVWLRLCLTEVGQSHELHQAIRNRMASRRVKQFSGLNVADFVAATRHDHLLLGGDNYKHAITASLLHQLIEDVDDVLFNFTFIGILDAINIAIPRNQHLSQMDQDIAFSSVDLDFETIMELMESKYIAAVQSGRWKAARNVPDSKQPVGFFSNPNASTLQSTISTGNDGNRNGIICYNCNKPGHVSRFCPEKRGKGGGKEKGGNQKSGQQKGGNQRGNGSTPGWRTTPPSGNGSQTCQHNGKTYHWCSKCGDKGRWTPSHNTDGHTGVRNSSQAGKTTTIAAPAAMVSRSQLSFDPAVWKCDLSPTLFDWFLMVLKNMFFFVSFIGGTVLGSDWVVITKWFATMSEYDMHHAYVVPLLPVLLFGAFRLHTTVKHPFMDNMYSVVRNVGVGLAVTVPRPSIAICYGYLQQLFGWYQTLSNEIIFASVGYFLLYSFLFVVSYDISSWTPVPRKYQRPPRYLYQGWYRRLMRRCVRHRTQLIQPQYHSTLMLPIRKQKNRCVSENDLLKEMKLYFADEKQQKGMSQPSNKYVPPQKRFVPSQKQKRKHYCPYHDNDLATHPVHPKPTLKACRCAPRFRKPKTNSPVMPTVYSTAGFIDCITTTAAMLTRVALQAPLRVRNAMPESRNIFPLIWDSGATLSVSPNKDDFFGDIDEPGVWTSLKGIAKGLSIVGKGTVQWSVQDENGNIRVLSVPAYYVPECPARLLGTTSLLQTYDNEIIEQTAVGMRMFDPNNDARNDSVFAPVDSRNNLPTITAYNALAIAEIPTVLLSSVSTTHKSNINLTEPEKELLRWHERLGHVGFARLQSIMRTGALATTQTRRLHELASQIKHPPKCAACQFGKQRVRSSPGVSHSAVRERQGVLRRDDLLSGQCVSVDHFVCGTKGRRFTSRGKENESKMFCGGSLFYDHASRCIFVHFMSHLNTHETIAAKDAFEVWCRDSGIIPQKYISDNGSAYTSRDYGKYLEDFAQITNFAGVGAHHHNANAERGIGVIMMMARTMLLHAAIHWPDTADICNWPMAVRHAVFLYNHLPDRATGISPSDLFTRSRWPHRKFLDLHVFGCPVYVLDKKLQDGGKIPKWKPRSKRTINVGFSDKHASTVPLVLDSSTGSITPQFHVVFDDWFATVATGECDIPNFSDDEWGKMFGESRLQYLFDDAENYDGDANVKPTIVEQRLEDRRSIVERVSDAIVSPANKPLTGPKPDLTPPLPHAVPMTEQRESVPTPVNDVTPVRLFDQREQVAPTNETTYLSPPSPPSPQSSAPSSSPISTSPIPLTASSPIVPALRRSSRNKDPIVHFDPGNEATHNDPSIVRSMNERTDSSVCYYGVAVEEESYTKQWTHGEPFQMDPACIHQFECFLHSCNSVSASENDIWFKTDSDDVEVYALKGSNPDLPFYDDALKRPDRDEWVKAMQVEIATLEKLGSWDEVPISDAVGKVLPALWVLKIKRTPWGELKKYKARFTARGDLQQKTGDEEEYSPVALWVTIRCIFILGWSWGWYMCSLDTVAAFLTARLPNPVWIALPRGFRSQSQGPTCLRLKKSLYGLSVASRLYWLNYTNALKDLGFVQNVYDPCLFTRTDCIMALWVDDTIIACKTKEIADKLMIDISSYGFELKHDSSLTEFLGLKIEHVDGNVLFKQPGLIVKVLETTSLYKANVVPTPALHEELGSDEDGAPFHETWSYRAVVGMLLYLSTNTRPDISCAVSNVARYSHNPKQSHGKAIKRIVRYLLGTSSLGLTVKPISEYMINMWVDAAFAGLHNAEPHANPIASKSRMGFIICLENTPILWQSKLLALTVLSTLEAEYMALSQGLRELLVVKRLMEAMVAANNVDDTRTVVRTRAYEDNQGALLLATRHRITARTRYFLARYHWFWEHYDAGTFEILPCSSKAMRGDFLTKQSAVLDFVQNRVDVMGG